VNNVHVPAWKWLIGIVAIVPILALASCDVGETSSSTSPSGTSSGQSSSSGVGGMSGAGWVHPGALDSKGELDFVKAQIAAGAQPWKATFDKIKNSGAANQTPHPLSQVNSSNGDASTSRDDALGAYTQALIWYYSGDEVYAQRAIAILNAWSGLQGFTAGTDQDKLQAGWIGAVFADAAEIMRLYPGWAPADIAKLQAMFKQAFYPKLNTASTWNGNVDLTQIDAMMAIAIFNEDQSEFDAGLARWNKRTHAYFYLASDGQVPPINGDGGNVQSFWSNPLKWVDGLQQETCRDNGHHAQFALGSALHVAEMAWHQGVDIYSGESTRFTAAMELLAKQFVTNDMQGICSNNTPSGDRYDTWEVGYNHYHNRKGIDLPNTNQLIVNDIRTKAELASWNLVYETLTHANVK
jgi:hypothetical protein